MGVCNGFQTMVKLGLLPGFDGDYFTQKMAMAANDCGVFQNFWVNVGSRGVALRVYRAADKACRCPSGTARKGVRS